MKKGVTGFWSLKEGIEPPRLDVGQIKRDFYTVARETSSKVEEIQEADITRNHHRVVIQFENGDRVTALINMHYPIVAFTQKMSPSDLVVNVQFKDHEALKNAIESSGCYKVATSDYLNEYPHGDTLKELNQAELDQIKYWRPERIGDVLFNHWD